MNAPLDHQTVVATATEFICKYISSENGQTLLNKHKLHPDSFPKPTKASGDFHCAADMLPIEIKFACDQIHKTVIERNLAQIAAFTTEKYSEREFAVDAYLVLTEIYSFLLGMRKQLLEHFGVTGARAGDVSGGESPSWPCDICGDDSYAEYCGSNVCGKCRSFFVAMMRARRSVATLKCSFYKKEEREVDHDGAETRELCTNDFGQVDVACDACRFWKCMKVGMVDEFYDTETQHPSTSLCEICRRGSNDLEFLLGTYVCSDCLESFKSSTEEDAFLSYECSCSAAAGSTGDPNGCEKCLFDRFKHSGFLDLYRLKAQGGLQGVVDVNAPPSKTVNLDIVFRDPEQCCACDNSAAVDSGLFLGVRACQVCRSFLQVSLKEEIYASYCCPAGECGRLCSVDATAEAARCKFCWLRRLEIEGMVDRWLICKGNTALWNEAEMEEEEEGGLCEKKRVPAEEKSAAKQGNNGVQVEENVRGDQVDDANDENEDGEAVLNVAEDELAVAESFQNGEEETEEADMKEAEEMEEEAAPKGDNEAEERGAKDETENDVEQDKVDDADTGPSSPKRRRRSRRTK